MGFLLIKILALASAGAGADAAMSGAKAGLGAGGATNIGPGSKLVPGGGMNKAWWFPIVVGALGIVIIITGCAGFAGTSKEYTGENSPAQGGITGSDEYSGGSGGPRGDCDMNPPLPVPHQVVTLPAWKYVNGKKVAGTTSADLNPCVIEEVKSIFVEIYNDPEKFPLTVGSSWRAKNTVKNGISRHVLGMAVDLNITQNWCYHCYGRSSSIPPNGYWKPGPDPAAMRLSGWSPGFDPRSIPLDNSVTKAFFIHGWGRGLYRSFNDFHHFSIDGG